MKKPSLKALASQVGKLAVCLTLLASTGHAQVVDKTPLLHMSFDHVGGLIVTNDGSGGSALNGTLNGTATIVPGGKFGNALSITGLTASAASCRIANAVVPLNVGAGQPPWSVAMWFQTTNVGGCFAYQGDGGWAGGNSSFYLTSGRSGGGIAGTHAGAVRNGQEWEEGTTAVNDGLWHHFVLTFDGTSKVMYLDGHVETFDENNWPGNGTGGQFWIGGNGYSGDGSVNLNGLIDEVYVFNVALSLADVDALVDSNSVPLLPVVATISPTSGFRGQTFTVTATATPAAGTATNATINLGAIGLATNANLVLSSANVFTNSFTVPGTSPIGLAALKVTVIDTEPAAGSFVPTFTVVPRPPTNAFVVTQLTPKTVLASTEASFLFATTNDAPIGTTNDVGFPMTYKWYKNNVLVSTNPMGPWFTFLATTADSGQPIYAVASVRDTNFSSISLTSAVVTLTVNSGTPVFVKGLKSEFFSGATRADAEVGNTGPGAITLTPTLDLPGGQGNNYTVRTSGYFIPQTTGQYVFFIASDDDSDLFLNTTGTDPNGKVLIAQETVWSNADQWQTSGGSSSLSQKRSDLWSPDGGLTVPYNPGISLTANQRYYIESIHRQGTGGDTWAVTYETVAELTSDPTQPIDGSTSRMTVASNNIAALTFTGTYIAWSNQPPVHVTVSEGGNTNISAVAGSDAEMAITYQWYLNNAPFAGATGTNLALGSIPFSYNNAQIYLVASRAVGGLSITSSVTTLTVNQAVHESGFVFDERWDSPKPAGGNWAVTDIINGNVPASANWKMALTEWGISTDNAGGHNDFVRRVTGFFKPPTTGLYTFYVTSDDDSILFLSTDATPGNKRQVAAQQQWNSGGYAWNTANNGGLASQSISDTFTIGAVAQNPGGIMLTNGQRYYIEQDMHQGGGGANLGATYTVTGSAVPVAGTKSALNGSVVETTVPRCSFVAFTKQPQNVANAPLGSKVAFSAAGNTDSQASIGGPRGYEETFVNNKLFFQWFTNGVAVPGANSSKFLMGPVTADMVGVTVMCQTRALGYTDSALNPIWTNSTSASITSTAAPLPPELIGHFVSGTADLNDTANAVSPGLYYGVPVRATTSTRFYYFTNDVPPGATAGAKSLYLNAQAIAITNTCISDPGYVLDTFDGTMASHFTVMAWAKGNLAAWNAFVTKGGDNGVGWAIRTGSAGNRGCWTVRGSGGTEDMQGPTENDANWHNYAGVYDVTTGIRTLYVDGVQKGQYTGQTAYTPASGHLTLGTEDLEPGNNYGNNGYITGLLYDVRIYNYALTQAQIVQIGNVPGSFTSSVSGNQITFTFPFGTLVQATNLTGPWTAVSTVSPATITTDPTRPALFFRVSNP